MGPGRQRPAHYPQRLNLMLPIGDALLDLFGGARSEVTIIAPFMKVGVVRKVVQSLVSGVELSCITRWHPYEIKAGVSDLEIWDMLRSHEPAKLLLIPTLHAKFYRADNRYAIGSANLTNAALGWSMRPNIELLVFGEIDSSLREWESCLLSQTTEVDESLVRYFERLVDDLPDTEFVLTDQNPGMENSTDLESVVSMPEVGSWLPATRYPEQLYEAYSGHTEAMSLGAREAAIHDLLVLAVPQGLDEPGFRASVAATMLQMPLIHEIDQFLTQPRRFGAVRDFLGSLSKYPGERDPSTDWQTVMRWFRHFLPLRFQVSVPNHSEMTFRIGPSGR